MLIKMNLIIIVFSLPLAKILPPSILFYPSDFLEFREPFTFQKSLTPTESCGDTNYAV